ncbi:MAG: DUF4389 domain-containing protein [Alphaproteobacteria bacterium]|nr:MAG: DUF4389 domain-containing protein [Alphaproteobacteria bacterium]
MMDMNDDYGGENPRWAVLRRGVVMLVFAFLFELGRLVLGAVALVQFGFMFVALERNRHLAAFGEALAQWLAAVARFQSGATDARPFPWAPWGA